MQAEKQAGTHAEMHLETQAYCLERHKIYMLM